MMRTAGPARAVRLVLLFVVLGAAPVDAIPLILRANLLSAGIGSRPFDKPFTFPADYDVQVINFAVGSRHKCGLGGAIGGTLLEFPRMTFTPWSGNQWIPGGVGVLEVTVFYGPSLRERPHGTMVYAQFGAASGRGGPTGLVSVRRFLKAGLGATWTFWAANPSVELQWRREYPAWAEEGDPYWDHRDQLSLLLRLAVGGWYEISPGDIGDTILFS